MNTKSAVLWDVTPCGSCKNRCFGKTYRLHHQDDKNQRNRNNVSSNYQRNTICVFWLLITTNVVPSFPILVTLKMEAIRSSETSVLTSQKTEFFIVTVVKTSKFTRMNTICTVFFCRISLPCNTVCKICLKLLKLLHYMFQSIMACNVSKSVVSRKLLCLFLLLFLSSLY
jgi:hypothetical protein